MKAIRRRKHASEHDRTRVRASIMIPHDRQSAASLQRGEDTTCCGLRVMHSCVGNKSVINQ
jgi:hypothetical protein